MREQSQNSGPKPVDVEKLDLSGFVDEAEVAALVHELAAETLKALPETDRKRLEANRT